MELTKTELADMYSKLPVRVIALKLSVSKPTVYRLLQDAGIKLRGQRKIKLVD